MKLVRLEHIRCDDYEGATYLWAADDLTEDQLYEDVQKAQKAYRAAAADVKEHHGQVWPRMGRAISINDFPDETTLGAFRAVQKAERDRAHEWERKKQAALRPFSKFMEDLGYKNFYEADPDIVENVDWGHSHGEIIDYGIAEISDMPGSLSHRLVEEKQDGITRTVDYIKVKDV